MIQTRFHRIGKGEPVYLIAEIGLNHNGDADLAIRSLEAAARSGAQCAKFQLFDSSLFINGNASLGDGGPGSLQTFFSQFELSQDVWQRVVRACDELGIDFLCSVFDEPSLDFYQSLGAKEVKVASTDLTCRPLLESMRRRGLSIYLSTGASNQEEIDRTISWIGAPELLFQCVSSYPADPSDYDLPVLQSWARYGCELGLSDHCTDHSLSIAAAALGATAIERHFTLDRNLPGPDHNLSSTPDEFVALSRSLSMVQSALAGTVKECKPSELPVRQGGRRGIYAARDLPAGHRLQASDLVAQRPGGNLAVERMAELLNRPINRALRSGDPVDIDLL
ncbi:MAG: N-acetylneuraminate synthase family protein [Leptospiraceae bacterium]|nr:N-acetylneuraminate synthase family protein [Leptospiraceae bacterium]